MGVAAGFARLRHEPLVDFENRNAPDYGVDKPSGCGVQGKFVLSLITLCQH